MFRFPLSRTVVCTLALGFVGLTTLGLSALGVSALGLSGEALASPASEVASAFDHGDHFDLHTSLTYEYSSRSSAIKREYVNFPGTAGDDRMPLVKDLLFTSSHHEIVPALELGVFRDLWLSAAMPIVVHDSRSLSFDQRAKPCVFPGGVGDPTCINAMNSSTIEDGLLPETGFDSNDPAGPGFTDPADPTIFRGPNRQGPSQLRFGIGFAPMNQDRDPSKPWWKVGAELRLPIGKTKKFLRASPSTSTGVSDGVTEVRLWTSMTKRVNWAQPHFEVWWKAPISVKKGTPLAELDRNFGATSTKPQQEAGTTFGVEATVWERPEDELRVGIDASTTLEAHFEGRGYSDMWEVFAYAGTATNAGAPLVLDADPTSAGVQAKSHPGVSTIENFMTVETQVQVTAQVGERIRFAAAFGMQYEQSHLISFADSGKDLPTCIGGATTGCEIDTNEVVDALGAGNATGDEVNPLYVPLIDVTGHRYRVAEGRSVLFTVNARILF